MAQNIRVAGGRCKIVSKRLILYIVPIAMETVLCITVGAYVLQLILLWLGLVKSGRRRADGTERNPRVSVIVAARNEEETIPNCIASLLRLDYPPENLELILVNDGSTDRTPQIISSFAAQHPSIRMVSTTAGTHNLKGKTNAVAQGIRESTGTLLLFTDADCTVSPGWVRETVHAYGERTGIVGGYTLLEASTFFQGMQRLDWMFLFSLASSTAGWGTPTTAIGNNLSVRRKAYDGTGGFEAIPFSVTEDYAIVQAVLKSTSYGVRFPVNPDALVRSLACQSWKQLYRQKQRWGVGGLDMIPLGMLLMAVGYLAKLALVVSLFTLSPASWIWGLAAMATAETGYILLPLARFKILSSLKYLPAFLLYFMVYVLALPFVALLSKEVVWKERHL